MDMKMLGENLIECCISVEELDSRWNVTVEDIVGGNEKGKNVIEFILSQSRRKFNINASGQYEISLHVESMGKRLRFVIKSLSEKPKYEDLELPYSAPDPEPGDIEGDTESKEGPRKINLAGIGEFPVVCYGYRFESLNKVIRACGSLPVFDCDSSLCKKEETYILIISAKQNVGDAVQVLLSEFTDDHFYLRKNCIKGDHEDILQGYSDIIISADALIKLASL